MTWNNCSIRCSRWSRSGPRAGLLSVDIDDTATCSHAAGLLMARERHRLALLMPRSEQADNIESERGCLQAIERYSEGKSQVAHPDVGAMGI